MRKTIASIAATLALGAMLGCDGEGNGVINPSPIDTAASSLASTSGLSVGSTFVTVDPVAQPVCPDVPPLLGSIGLTVEAGQLDVSIDQVQMRFTDSSCLTAPPVTLPAPAVTTQFGTNLIPATSERLFPLSFPFGCDTGPVGTLVIVVFVTDENGRSETREVRVALG